MWAKKQGRIIVRFRCRFESIEKGALNKYTMIETISFIVQSSCLFTDFISIRINVIKSLITPGGTFNTYLSVINSPSIL